MRPQPETIRLGVHEWQVRPLTLRQVQEIEPILMPTASESQGNVAAAMAIVAIALRRDHADMAAALGDIEATAPEIGAAMATVLRLGGFIEAAAQRGDDPLGELHAGKVPAMEPPESTSPSSTQGS